MTGESGVVMRRRSMTEIVDLAMCLMREEGRVILVSTAPWWLISGLAAAAAWTVDPWLGFLAAFLLGRIAQVPALLVASDRAAGRPPIVGFGRVARGLGSCLLPVAGWVLVASLGLLIPPIAFFVWLRLVFLLEVYLLEQPESGASARVGALFSAEFGVAFAARCWTLLIEIWLILGSELTGQLVVGSLFNLGDGFGNLMRGEATPFLVVGTLAAQPLLSLVRFAAYLDVRTRREGLDAWFALWTAANRAEPA